VTKALTVVLVLRAIERGQSISPRAFRISCRSSPGRGREKIEIHHRPHPLLRLPSVYSPREGMYIDVLDDVVAEICKKHLSAGSAGQFVRYAPICITQLMGDALRRTDRRSVRSARSAWRAAEAAADEGHGDRPAQGSAQAPSRAAFRGNSPTQHLGHSNLASTARSRGIRGNALGRRRVDGRDITASPKCCGEKASSTARASSRRRWSAAHIVCWTGDKPNELYRKIFEIAAGKVLPAASGSVSRCGGDRMGTPLFGTLTSPETFGNHGAGTTLFWVDPELDMTFVGLTTGVMNSRREYRALAAALRHRGHRGGLNERELRLRRRRRGHRGLCACRAAERGPQQLGVSHRGRRRGLASVHTGAGFCRGRDRSAAAQLALLTAPQPKLNDRRIPVPRGHVIGGSGSINGMVYFRGHRGTSTTGPAMGNHGWSYREVLPYFIRSEANEAFADSPLHGHEGPIKVTQVRKPNPMVAAFMEAMRSLVSSAMTTSTAATPKATARARARFATVARDSTAVAFLRPAARATISGS